MSFSGFNPQIDTQVVQIRDGTIYQELIGVKRVWVHPWRDAVCQISSAYYDITIMELGKCFFSNLLVCTSYVTMYT